MIDTFVSNLENKIPQLKDYKYDFETGKFTDRNGEEVTANRFRLARSNSNIGAARAGEAALRTAILTKSIISSESSQRPALLEKLFNQSNQVVTQGNLTALFSFKDNANAIATNLSNRLDDTYAPSDLSEIENVINTGKLLKYPNKT